MHQKLRIRFGFSCADYRKSKVENPKSVGVLAIGITLAMWAVRNISPWHSGQIGGVWIEGAAATAHRADPEQHHRQTTIANVRKIPSQRSEKNNYEERRE